MKYWFHVKLCGLHEINSEVKKNPILFVHLLWGYGTVPLLVLVLLAKNIFTWFYLKSLGTYDDKFMSIVNTNVHGYMEYERIRNDSNLIYSILSYRLEFFVIRNSFSS